MATQFRYQVVVHMVIFMVNDGRIDYFSPGRIDYFTPGRIDYFTPRVVPYMGKFSTDETFVNFATKSAFVKIKS